MKRSKAYRAAAEKVNLDQLYSPEEALALVASGASAKFDETVDVAIPKLRHGSFLGDILCLFIRPPSHLIVKWA